MDKTDIYYTINSSTEGEFKDRGSKFFAYLHPIKSEEEFVNHLNAIRSSHPKANHHCYAYRLLESDVFRHSDDGEPSGTAGNPIYNQLLSNKIINVSCIVVRYFGGTKLGTSGLINAYKLSAKEAITASTIIEKYLTTDYILSFDYGIMGTLMKSLKHLQFDLTEKSFEANPFVKVSLRLSEHELLIKKLKAHYLNRSIDDIEEDTSIPGLKITHDPNFSDR